MRHYFETTDPGATILVKWKPSRVPVWLWFRIKSKASRDDLGCGDTCIAAHAIFDDDGWCYLQLVYPCGVRYAGPLDDDEVDLLSLLDSTQRALESTEVAEAFFSSDLRERIQRAEDRALFDEDWTSTIMGEFSSEGTFPPLALDKVTP